jgi:hypothetical protein
MRRGDPDRPPPWPLGPGKPPKMELRTLLKILRKEGYKLEPKHLAVLNEIQRRADARSNGKIQGDSKA